MKKSIIYRNKHPLALEGACLKAGDKAPDFILENTQLQNISLHDFKGKIIILSCVPSLDTPTCDLETRRFNQEAAQLGSEVIIVTVSRDLPFAQARWCAAHGIKNIQVLSDYKNTGFAQDYGVWLPQIGLLARAVFLIDKQGIIKYIQFVEEISHEPNYQIILEKTRQLLNR